MSELEGCPVCGKVDLSHPAHTIRCHEIELLWKERNDLQRKLDDIEDTLHKMENWCNAYPLDIFPEPDLSKAKLVLESHRMSLDSISAHAMRHVVNGMKSYVQEALKKLEDEK